MRYKTIKATLQGTTALLQHRATEEALGGNTRNNNPRGSEDPREICEKAIYRMPRNHQIAVPGAAFARCYARPVARIEPGVGARA